MSNQGIRVVGQITSLLQDARAVSDNDDASLPEFQLGDSSIYVTPRWVSLFYLILQMLGHEFPTVHRKMCGAELQFLFEKIGSSESDCIESKVIELIGRMEKLGGMKNVVYVQVAGICLDLPEVNIGRVKLMPSSHPDVDAHRLAVQDLKGGTQPVRADITLARVEVSGEVEAAVELAMCYAQEALDILQVLPTVANMVFAANQSTPLLVCAEPLPVIACRRWVYSSKDHSWGCKVLLDPILASPPQSRIIRLGAELLKEYENSGLSAFNALLLEGEPSQFDRSILTAVHWYAKALREKDIGQKYLSLCTALEGLFVFRDTTAALCPDEMDPVITVENGAACLLESDFAKRKNTLLRVRELMRARSRIVLGGWNTGFESPMVSELTSLCSDCCMKALQMRTLFQYDGAFGEWLRQGKQGGVTP